MTPSRNNAVNTVDEVLHLLRKYLGEYVHGLSAEALRISVWKGDVVLRDLKLKAEALNSLKLPVTVKAGFVGTVTLKVPWKSLGKEPVIVCIDRVFILAHPAPDERTLKASNREKLFEVKLQQIEEAESATLEAKARSKLGNPPGGNSWLGSLIATIIGNLKISITNVHIRYEDSVSNPGHPFSSGVTLAKLAAVTMDEQGNETFDTSGALDKLRKSLQLDRLAVYHNSDNLPWTIDKKWEDLTPKEWIEIFEDGINEPANDHGVVSLRARNRQYLVSPINGALKYHRLGNQERVDPEIPFEKASLFLSDVSLTITEAQYHDCLKLLEVVSRYKTHVDVSHLRPVVPVSEDPLKWWRYAVQAGLQQKKMCYRFSWDRIRYLCQLRRRYIQLYASSLQQLKVDNTEIREIERDLDSKVILLWRLLAHAKVESLKSKEAAQQSSHIKRSWFSFKWRTSSEDASAGSGSEGSLLMEEKLTKEEWQAINKLLSYQPDEELTSHVGKDMQNMIRYLVNVSIGQAAARIISINQTEILCGRFEQLNITAKLYPRMTRYDVSLRFYGLSAPEGSLAQSVSSEKKVNALAASFVNSPLGENVDWRLSATIAPCHVTVLMESYDRFLEFMRRSNAVSPTVALETATALQQMKIEKVTRRAQEQFQMVLEEQKRFALDIDFDAPKVRVPLRTGLSSKCDGHFLLDFGHFTLCTKEGQHDDQRHSIYSRFYIAGRDIAAFFTDCGSESGNCTLVTSISDGQYSRLPLLENVDHFCPLIDRCGMAVMVDQIKIPHPSFPSTRVSFQVPNLGIHFSPARYCRILELLNIFYGTVENVDQVASEISQTGLAPWSPADLSSEARILVWRGIGNSVAEWQPCFLALSGFYLYVLESEASHSYQRCSSMAGRQVYEVPPTSVGGSLFSVAVGFRGMDIQKALESSTTLIIEFRDEGEKATWLKGLVQATYRASAPPSVDVFGESHDVISEHAEHRATNYGTADLVINGALVETKLLIYGKTGGEEREDVEETLILEILAGGGKVHLVRGGGDLAVKTKLHSLKIKDELQGHLSLSPQYLACSVLKEETVVASSSALDSNEKELSEVLLEENDIFTDALPDFMSISDPSYYSQNADMPYTSECYAGVDSAEALTPIKTPTKGKGISGEIFYEAQDNDTSDFVVVTFSTRSSGSPYYDGTDTQMSISMSKLEFFCNRPTLVALIGLGLDLSSAGSEVGSDSEVNAGSGVSSASEVKGPKVECSEDREKTEDSGRSFVKGLLGYGKGRIVFHLNMDVDSVCMFLNKEDGSQLAMLVQESFLLDLKVHPSSLSIEGTLGNFRLCDLSLGMDHCWGWLCDIRNQGVESLIKFTFNSYSAEDEDYEGYDYSLSGRLSAVRIVFLYKFVQEVTMYFMELATPRTEEAIKLVDKVGGFEWLIQKYEIDGASALRLDLSLDTPIIIIPRNSMSNDFMQLDLGQLQVTNEISWHGSSVKDPSAVHLDVLHAEIFGINMAIGVNGLIGKPMIREGQGLHIYVRRSLRDVFRKVPTLSVEIKVGSLHGVMSGKEYNVILNCAYMNISEEPKLPPSFRGNLAGPKDTIRMLVDKVNYNSQIFLSRTVTVVAVEVNYALLELYNGIDEESPLAQIALEGLWVSYRMTSMSETDLYVTIPIFSVIDIRPDTRPEMRLMLGSSSDISKQDSTGNFPIGFSNVDSMRKNLEAPPGLDIPISTMLLMDYRFRASSQSYVVRLQQPRVLVVLDFLLAVGEFFVPSLGAITGREETLDPKNDPITRNNNIVLNSPVYKQRDDVVHLSPNRQLIADVLGVDEYTYDGCGQTIFLSEGADLKETSTSRFHPIIVIGRGKRLRFVNVKIKNGVLLRTHTYLSNESSYSVSVEDGVSIDSFTSDNETTSLDSLHGSSKASSVALTYSECENQIQSVTFEAQAVSPEFTFYDSTKSSMDDSSHCEKLLRVKMNLSFMYASKENDTWIRTLVKDLTIEAGSGLVILDPVDISGGYTSVKDKTNISLISTDICIRLSLSVISLILNLQNQAAEALQLGNACPLASCTNFDRLWVSRKESGATYNLTFWRPRAPSNYVILGDCVTSRPIPPSQAVMAVSNTYGRVRKPLGFKLIGLLASILELEGDGEQSDIDGDCSLWMPIPPPGYLAVGCVAHIGSQPPPNHIVYCIRSDLVTTTTYSECIFSIQSTPRFLSGFSIWRLDNVVGSFYAHSEAQCPSKEFSCDLGHVLVWNSNRHHSSPQYPASASDLAVNHDYETHQGGNNSSSSSGWDILRSISRASSSYMSTPHFERIWWDKGSDLRRPVSIWRPLPRPGYAILGDCITEGLEPPALGIIFKCDYPEISAKPVQFAKVAHIVRKGLDDAFFWYPIAPPGYASLGCMVSKKDEAPRMDSICCPRLDLVNPANILEVPISRSSSSKGSHCWSIWKACTFLARSDLKKPSSRLAYTIGDSVKPKTRENVTGEMKLRCCSLTVLDSLCGMMTPLFDLTITNINLATHGRLEAMNAVLISSIAASTFNTQLEAWEPLLEPFDGIFKFETYDSNEHLPSRVGKRVRLAATSILNINISAANLKTFAEATVSWKRYAELEQKSTKANKESGSQLTLGDDSTFSALDEDDFQTVIVENKLGCDIYLKKVEQNSETIELLQHEQYASAWIPPPRFSDRLNVVAESREGRNYVAVQIFEARGLPITDDGNGHSFFCALRLVVDSQATDQQKLFPQSARTKCVKPLISKINDLEEGTAKWNELFIFEVPRKGLAKLEVEVTNLAAKAGKGEVVGAVSISTGHKATTLKKVASVRMLRVLSDVKTTVSYPLRKRGQLNVDEGVHDCGCLSISTYYFERKTIANLQREMESVNEIDRDVGFWIGFGKEGPWESFRSLLPLSVVPRSLKENFIALEVVMKNGKKHAILRGLATVVNESDVKLDLSVCPVSLLRNRTPLTSEVSHHNAVVEEVFENQRYQSISGWGNKWPGFRGNDPGRWSTRDFSYSSKDFFEPPLPSGWRWTSTWTVDKSQFVDMDGWAYASDYHSLKWPPTSKSCTKSSLDFVRRRRWIRTRQPLATGSISSMNDVVTVLSPGSSSILPWRSTARDSDLCIQVRPHVEYPEPPYTWGHPVAVGSGYASDNEQGSLSRQNTMQRGNALSTFAFKLNQLEKKDILLHCDPSTGGKQYFGLSIGTDASVLHTELNAPVYDWKISVNSPLKLENRLPCPAEFTVWERTKDGISVDRQHGIISSRRSVHIYSADMQKPIYLTLFVQGGWVLEKDPILILDLSSLGHVSFFWMVHQQSKRRLRVSVERDMGATSAAPKTIRFFVPYCIRNDSSLPLSYRMVEVEPLDSVEVDTPLLSKVKSAKQTLRNSTSSNYRKSSSIRKNVQVLEAIEELGPSPVMLSPQDYAGRGGASSFPSRNDTYLSPRVGISVAIRHSEYYSPGVSLVELENKEHIDVKAFTSNGSYYKLSALLNMTSDRTKVVHFQPQSVFINRVGLSVCLQQYDTQLEEWFHPTDPPKPFQWKSSGIELLKLRMDGYKWSTPFSIGSEGVMCIHLKNSVGSDQMSLRVEVRSGTKKSRYEVLLRPSSFSSPYRIENRSMFLPIRFRQVDGASDSWRSLLPNAASSFLWEDLGRKRLLEVFVDGTDPSKAEKYSIDEIFDHYPSHGTGGPARALRVTVLKEEKMNVIKISDWMPEDEPPSTMPRRDLLSFSKLSRNDSQNQQPISPTDSEFHFILELADLGLSIIDHTPEEILYLSVQNLLLSHSSGLGSGISRFKLRMSAIQVDNQLPLTPMPVLFRPQRTGEQLEYILKLSFTTQSNGSQDICVYPYIGFHGLENSAFLINIHEPIIWRLHEMIQQVNPSRFYETQTTAVSVDPIIQIGVLNISEIRFKVSMAMSPTQRPRGVLGFWSSLMTALGNTENMPVRINQRFHEDICMRQSALISNAISNIQKDLLGQPLQLLSGVDILGNASSALGHMSKGVAALSMDKKFIQSRQRQESKVVEDIGDVIREGGGALAKGLFRGVTGILTKPLEGAKSSGVEGFVQGVGKGIIGAAAQPVSGVLDLLSKTTEGANAVRMKITSAITSEEQLLRRRLPRVISGDNLLHPYDDYRAQGQVILQLAESGAFFGQVDLFKVRGKFALSDSYEDHFLLPKGKILIVTHRRVILLQQPSNIMAQRKFSPARDPCSVLWDVLWDDLMTMELTHGKKDHQKAPPSRLILYLQTRSTESREQTRVIKCSRESQQAAEIYSSIEQAMSIYGPNHAMAMQKKKVTKPYSPGTVDSGSDVVPKEGACIWSPQQVPASVSLRSTFGSSST
ncbi:Peroxin/Ferlin domain [Macleaya cordata]|uniref:Peroxin/Ferlin domain n=1 Tax=Macleaya cordata TaxID=56857 RepID=A0A200R1X2_MACCD|nr:Peroxin/Ferlin domain [Macleaya cordata]